MNYKEYQDLSEEDLKSKIIALSNTYSVSKNAPQYARLLKLYISKTNNISDFTFLAKFLANKGVSLMNIEKDSNYYYSSSDYNSYKTFMGHIYNAYYKHLMSQQYKAGVSHASSYIEALVLVDSLGDGVEKDINWKMSTLRKLDKLNGREIDPVFSYLLNRHGIDILKQAGKGRYYYSFDSSRQGGVYQIVQENAKEYLDFVFSIAKNTNKDSLLNSMVKAMLKDEYKNEHSSITNNTLFLSLEEELGIKKEQRLIKESLQKFNKKKLKKKKKEQLAQASNMANISNSAEVLNNIVIPTAPKKFKL